MVGAEYGSTFTSTPSGILFNVEDVGDSSTPFSYSNGSTFVGTSGIVQAGDSLTLWTNTTGTGTAEAVLTVPDFFYEAPSTPPPTQITNLFASHASGTYQTQGCYTAIHSSSTSTLFVYQIGNPSWGGLLADHTISYDTNSKIWADVGNSNPYYVCDGSTWADTTASSANQQTLSFWQNSTHVVFELTNPYYEA